MGDADHLRLAGDGGEFLTHHLGGASADAGIDFIKDERGHTGAARGNRFQCQHDTRELTTGSDLRQRLGRLSRIRRDVKGDHIDTVAGHRDLLARDGRPPALR